MLCYIIFINIQYILNVFIKFYSSTIWQDIASDGRMCLNCQTQNSKKYIDKTQNLGKHKTQSGKNVNKFHVVLIGLTAVSKVLVFKDKSVPVEGMG